MYLTKKQASDKKLIQYLAEQSITEPVSSIEKLGGAMSWNYEINGHIILKLPKENPLIQDWENQAKINPILQQHLSVAIPQPFTKKVFMNSSAEEPLCSMTYEKINGNCIRPSLFKKLPKQYKERYFDQLADVMLQLHSIPLELMPFEFITSMEYIKKYVLNKLGKNPLITPEFLDRLLFNRFFGFKRESLKNDRLCHGDLHSGNVCLDSKGNIVGILDFDTLTRGDIFTEFRPYLYRQNDMQLFLNKYLNKSKYPIDLKQIDRYKKLSKSFQFFAIFYKLFQLGIQPGQKLKQIIQHKKETSK